MTLPNFLVLGAAKSGTSAMYHHLRQHPAVFMPEMKEPLFWGAEGHEPDFQGPDLGMNRSITTLEEYEALFEGAAGYKAVGEASCYLASPTAPASIRSRIPGVRMIVLLRHPADRAFSSYCHMRRDGYEQHSFERGLKEEPDRIRARWSPLFWYVEMGFYARYLSRFLEHFPREQFRIYLYEDFSRDPRAVLRDVFGFLEVDSEFEPVLEKVNVSGIPRSRLVHSAFKRDNLLKSVLKPLFPSGVRARIQAAVRRLNIGPKPKLSPHTRRELIEVFREDILQLQEILDRDLGHWLDPGAARSSSSAERSGSRRSRPERLSSPDPDRGRSS